MSSAAVLALSSHAAPVLAQTVAEFYKGKQIRGIIRSSGSYDLYTRLLGILTAGTSDTDAIDAARAVVGFEVEPSSVKDAEEDLVPVKPLAAKHPAELHARQAAKLLAHKRAETFVRHQ